MKVVIRMGLGGELYAIPPDNLNAFDEDVVHYGEVYISNASDEIVVSLANDFNTSWVHYKILENEIFLRTIFP